MSENLFFYNSSNGAGAVASVNGNSLGTVVDHQPGSIPSGANIVAGYSKSSKLLLLYNRASRSATFGHVESQTFGSGISADVYVTDKKFPPNSFNSWTNICWTLVSKKPLFYDRESGSGEEGFDPPIKVFPPGSFDTGWTDIVFVVWTGIEFFYNRDNGAACVGFDPPTKLHAPGSFATGWTAIDAGPPTTLPGGGAGNHAQLLFYNSNKRSGALATLGFNGDVNTIRTWGQNAFDFWTHVVGFGGGWLFYDGFSGKAVIGTLTADNSLTSTPVNLSAGWTHITRVGRP
ncbi:hypothetical protein ACFQ9Q_17520 [Streptomyces virginiae]|uniref:hypothetical protein n=1 Tax=Streptomyces virginiae TaxID=1961 RepID=UPI003699A35E